MCILNSFQLNSFTLNSLFSCASWKWVFSGLKMNAQIIYQNFIYKPKEEIKTNTKIWNVKYQSTVC